MLYLSSAHPRTRTRYNYMLCVLPHLLRRPRADHLGHRCSGLLARMRSLLLVPLVGGLRGGHAERHTVVHLVAGIVAVTTSGGTVGVVFFVIVLGLVVAVAVAAWIALVQFVSLLHPLLGNRRKRHAQSTSMNFCRTECCFPYLRFSTSNGSVFRQDQYLRHNPIPCMG